MRERSVLIVDDDAGAAEAFEPMLTSAGFCVRLAYTAATGFHEIELDRPSAIVLDLHLGSMDGLEFLRHVRSTPRNEEIPVAVVTGDYLVDDRVSQELNALGATLFFKPLWAEDLVEIVQRLADRTY